jgi:hypothetical protein
MQRYRGLRRVDVVRLYMLRINSNVAKPAHSLSSRAPLAKICCARAVIAPPDAGQKGSRWDG